MGGWTTGSPDDTGGECWVAGDATFWLETWIFLDVRIVGVDCIYYLCMRIVTFLGTRYIWHKW
jgi:hypothetical protein